MKPQSEKTSTRTYLEHGYNYIVVETETEYWNQPMYDCTFFKTRRQAQWFNERRLKNTGKVLTTRQAMREFDFIVE